jgi:hypothetical protein
MTSSRWIIVGLLAASLCGAAGWTGVRRLRAESARSTSYTPTIPNRTSVLLDVYDTLAGVRLFRATAARLVAGRDGNMSRLSALMEWTYENVRPSYAAPSRVVFDDAYRIAKRGFGYCDQSAHVFATLATYAGYRSRLWFLRGADGVSHHSVAQVDLDGRWVIVDPWVGLIPTNNDGTFLTVDDVAANPALINRLGYGQLGITAADFARGRPFSTFPYQDLSGLARRVWRRISADRSDSDENAIAESQTAKGRRPPVSARVLFDEARQRQLEGRFTEAISLYNSVRAATSDERLLRAVAFFTGLALLNAGEPAEAIETFSEELERHPDSPWRKSLVYFRAKAEGALDRTADAEGDYSTLEFARARLDLRDLRVASAR